MKNLSLTIISSLSILVASRTIEVKNSCSKTIWPGITGVLNGNQYFGRKGSQYPAGFELGAGQTRSFPAPNGLVAVRSWARMGCRTEADGKFRCDIGDCGDPVNGYDGTCYLTGGNSLAELSVDPNGLVYYDLSLVDGYTIPVRFNILGKPVLVPNLDPKFNCKSPKCSPTQFTQCPPELIKRDSSNNPIACYSISKAMYDDDLRSKSPALQRYYDNPVTRSHVACDCVMGSCAGSTVDEVRSNIITGPRGLAAVDSTGFCCSPKNPLYNADGIRGHICYATEKPMPLNGFNAPLRYDEIFKQNVCPEAYSWEFDDENSTFLCKGDDVVYQIEFC